MADQTRQAIERYKPEITRILEEAAIKGDTQGLIKWMQEHTNLSLERQAEVITEFKRILADDGARIRRKLKKKK